MLTLRRIFRASSVPPEYHHNFIHLYFDIGWFGVLSGSAVNFLNVYATRLGASGFQIGLLGATSAIVNLIFAIPVMGWLEKRPVGKAVFWTSVFYRLGFLLWIPLPWLFSNQGQVWALILITLLMGIPLTALTVGFNALFAAAVPTNWRAHVAGIRNVVLSPTFIISSLGSGYLLNHMPFTSGYQVVFAIGFLGAMMSSFHLYFIQPLTLRHTLAEQPQQKPSTRSERSKHRRNWHTNIRADIWQTPFRSILLVLLAFHIAQYLPIPLFPLYFVRKLNLNDSQIGTGMAAFYLSVLIGSTQLARLTHRLDHKRVTAFGVLGMSIYPALLALARGFGLYMVTSILGGFAWAMVGGALINYLLDKVPAEERPPYLAWYNIILNAAILFGSLLGPILANQIGLSTALILFGVLRLLSGLAILRWG